MGIRKTVTWTVKDQPGNVMNLKMRENNAVVVEKIEMKLMSLPEMVKKQLNSLMLEEVFQGQLELLLSKLSKNENVVILLFVAVAVKDKSEEMEEVENYKSS